MVNDNYTHQYFTYISLCAPVSSYSRFNVDKRPGTRASQFVHREWLTVEDVGQCISTLHVRKL